MIWHLYKWNYLSLYNLFKCLLNAYMINWLSLVVTAICSMYSTLLGKECTIYLLPFFSKKDSDLLHQVLLEHPLCFPLNSDDRVIWLLQIKIWAQKSKCLPMKTIENEIRKIHSYHSIPCIIYSEQHTQIELGTYCLFICTE